ncbi:MAG: 50S ribosomal protein L6 [Balneolaceae bacterium]|jgi:large subunit ribosomal protein L6|nr:50S ribosomal protein L6 [Balneolaceae bacterium]MDR9447312.1 50S ribosomal protein L6 [Balneolaceae bacterium]
MSRIGKNPIALPDQVTVDISADNLVTVKGAKGENQVHVKANLAVTQQDNAIVVNRHTESKEDKAMHGLYRSLIENMVIGVSQGFVKELEIIGVGFRAAMSGNVLELNIGFSHPIFFMAPDGISIDVDTKRGKNPIIVISGHDKELVGQVAAKIRGLRKPEPYKGKGIRYLGEQIRRKAGKSAAK